MTFGWSELKPSASFYVEPTGFTAPPFDGDGEVARLAGTSVYFSAVKLIAAEDGKRVYEALAPLEWLGTIKKQLHERHVARFERIWRHLTSPRAPLELPGFAPLSFDRPRVMGIVNVTPDSFSDGGRHLDKAAAIEHGQLMRVAGADIVDVGGESTRPGAKAVWEGDEIERVAPVVEALSKAMPVSIDTRKAAVMRAAIDKGALIINDVSALRYDEDALDAAAKSGLPVVLMHSKGDPATMLDNPVYDDALLDVFDDLEARIEACEEAGIPRRRIIIDPGIGFAKNLRHNLSVLNGLAIYHGLGCPLLLGVSRKRFIGALSKEEEAEKRLPGSIAAAVHGLSCGVHILRVHDVAETKQAVAIWRGLADAALMPSI